MLNLKENEAFLPHFTYHITIFLQFLIYLTYIVCIPPPLKKETYIVLYSLYCIVWRGVMFRRVRPSRSQNNRMPSCANSEIILFG